MIRPRTRLITMSFVALLSVATIVSAVVHAQSASATARGSDFDAGHIIDDAVFYNNGSMTAAQIQTFLSSKVPTCDTNGTMSASDWGYPNLTHAQLAQYKREGSHGFKKDTGFNAPPYTCLKDYKQKTPQMEAASGLCGALSAKSTRTAAQIIKDVSDACGINPQVLTVLLEKEQSLVTDYWPLTRQYKSATGFDCPDTAPCDPAYAGFFYQVYNAAKQFKIYQAYPTTYNYIAGRTNRIYWQTNLGNWVNSSGNYSSSHSNCGYSNVYIQNQATAALYIYTPYQPNQKALANMYGLGDSCSAYGNRNFWRLFTDWFGSTRYTLRGAIGSKYTALGGQAVVGDMLSNEIAASSGGVYQRFQNGRIYWKSGVGAWYVHGGIQTAYLSLSADKSYFGYPLSDEITSATGVYQQFQGGRIYWSNADNKAYNVHGGIYTEYSKLSADKGTLGTPISNEISTSNGIYQQFQNGRIYWSEKTNAWSVTGAIMNQYQTAQWSSGSLGFPTTDATAISSGTVQRFQGGSIYVTTDNQAYVVHGGIQSRYTTTGADSGYLGAPMSNETAIAGGIYQQFQNGRIYWSNAAGARDIHGAIQQRYLDLGAHSSYLGLPTSNETAIPGGIYQQFQNGRVYWSGKTGAWDVHGAIQSTYQKLGAEKSKLGYPVSAELTSDSGTGTHQEYSGGTITWHSGSTTTVAYKK